MSELSFLSDIYLTNQIKNIKSKCQFVLNTFLCALLSSAFVLGILFIYLIQNVFILFVITIHVNIRLALKYQDFFLNWMLWEPCHLESLYVLLRYIAMHVHVHKLVFHLYNLKVNCFIKGLIIANFLPIFSICELFLSVCWIVRYLQRNWTLMWFPLYHHLWIFGLNGPCRDRAIYFSSRLLSVFSYLWCWM